MAILLYAIIGLVAGFFSGLLGIGGGIVVVPCLLIAFSWLGLPVSVHLAVGTSLATIIITLCASMNTHLKHNDKHFLWNLVKQFVPGVILGTLLGSYIASQLSNAHLSLVFGLIVWLLALRVFFSTQIAATEESQSIEKLLPSKLYLFLINTFIGILAAIMGIGGGGFTITFLQIRKISMHVAIPIATIMGIPVAILGTLTYMILGYHDPILPAWSTGYVYWPAVLGISLTSIFTANWGARLALQLPNKWLKTIFIILLIIIGAKMIF